MTCVEIHLVIEILKLKQLNLLSHTIQIWLALKCLLLIFLDLYFTTRRHHHMALPLST